MREPTYSVFVRFRRKQRLTLKRAVPLDSALRFASTVRGERFHRPEDVFIIDDATGETVIEPAASSLASASAPLEVAIAANTPELSATLQDAVQAPNTFADRAQLRNAQVTVRGSQRLTAAVERSLDQLTRLMALLRCSTSLLSEAEQVATDASNALEHIRHAQEVLRCSEAKLAAAPYADEVSASLKTLTAARLGERRFPVQKHPLRAKG